MQLINRIIVLVFIQALAQTSPVQLSSFEWQGVLLSESNNRPIGDAHLLVKCTNKAFYYISDGKGLVDIYYTGYSINDSVTISHLGYKSIKIPCKEMIMTDTIKLEEKYMHLDEVQIVSGPGNTNEIGPSSPKRNKYAVGFFYGTQNALYFPGSSYRGGKIKQVEFTYQEFDKQDTIGSKLPLRLRIYKHDSVLNKPGEDLLIDTIYFFKPKCSNKVVIDISAFNVYLPRGGFYCGVEVLPVNWYVKHKYISRDDIMYKSEVGIMAYYQPLFAFKKENKKESFVTYSKGKLLLDWTNTSKRNQIFLVKLLIEES